MSIAVGVGLIIFLSHKLEGSKTAQVLARTSIGYHIAKNWRVAKPKSSIINTFSFVITYAKTWRVAKPTEHCYTNIGRYHIAKNWRVAKRNHHQMPYHQVIT